MRATVNLQPNRFLEFISSTISIFLINPNVIIILRVILFHSLLTPPLILTSSTFEDHSSKSQMGEYRQELMTLMKREDLGNKREYSCL